MNKSRALVRTLVLCGLASLTFAYDGNVSYVPPSAYTNGDPLLEQDISHYAMYCNGAAFTTITSIIGTTTVVIDLTPLGEGTHSCTLRTVMLNGSTSADSNIASFTVGPRTPQAPTLTIVLQ